MSAFQHLVYFVSCDIVGAQMNAVGSGGKRDVSAGVDEQASSHWRTSSRFSVLSSRASCLRRPYDGGGSLWSSPENRALGGLLLG